MKKQSKILLASLFITIITQQASAFSRGRPIWDRRSTSVQQQPTTPTPLQPPIVTLPTQPITPVPVPTTPLVQQNSKWYVAEAIGPVVSTAMSEFIARSKNKAYQVYRFRHFDPATMKAAMLSAIQKYNKPYDIYFEFDNTRTYCSELTYKVMLDVTGVGLGRVEKMRDMKLDGPYVKALVQKRLTEIGKTLNLDEDIITPVSQMMDSNVTLVTSSSSN